MVIAWFVQRVVLPLWGVVTGKAFRPLVASAELHGEKVQGRQWVLTLWLPRLFCSRRCRPRAQIPDDKR